MKRPPSSVLHAWFSMSSYERSSAFGQSGYQKPTPGRHGPCNVGRRWQNVPPRANIDDHRYSWGGTDKSVSRGRADQRNTASAGWQILSLRPRRSHRAEEARAAVHDRHG